MARVWYCRTCGYEVTARGRCHLCRQRLVASALPELEVADNDEDEVGYRLDEWDDRGRGRLIEALNEEEIPHRFEEDELVVEADQEARVDDLLAEVLQKGATEDAVEQGWDGEDDDEEAELLGEALDLLLSAATKLREDPTDMQADADVAEVSAAIFVAEGYWATDADTWAAIGRVTRRLLGALGSEEAMEDEIRRQAAILVVLLEPVVAEANRPDDPGDAGDDGSEDGAEVAAEDDEARDEADGSGDAGDESGDADADVDEPADEGGEAAVADADAEASAGGDEVEGGADSEASDEADGDLGRTVYELPEWLPEQRAELSLLLDAENIAHEWDGVDLLVPAESETEVEGLFDQVEGVGEDEEDDEVRYHALEELFAALNRLSREPEDPERRADFLEYADAVEGPTPLGLDEADWWRIRRQARTVADAVEHDAAPEILTQEATTLRDLLRALL